ncbi:Prophage tail fibre N-terminal [Klebsiella pneumoniae]|nr:Prophage tail fibre N-terminal [Klebsiella pneumoniae]
MSVTIKISGTYRDPETNPLPGVTLSFESVYNSSQTQLQTTVKTVTDDEAFYSISLVPDVYRVTEFSKNQRKKLLGVIQIFADSVDGTLNEYLTSFRPDQVRPGILAEMEEILEEAKKDVEGAMFDRGIWSQDEIYSVGDTVSVTDLTTEGLYVCKAESTTNYPVDSPDWERIAGTASRVDGLSGSNGNLSYNRVVTVTDTLYTVPVAGELSWTLNIAASTKIDISAIMSDSNPNPASVVRLVISASNALSVALTGADNYWLEDGTSSSVAPVYNIDVSQPMTIIEISRVSNSAAPGALVRQIYPVADPGVVIPAVDQPGALGLFIVTSIDGENGYPPGKQYGASALYYGTVLNNASRVIYRDQTQPAAGTWETRTIVAAKVYSVWSLVLAVRVDNATVKSTANLKSGRRIRNIRYGGNNNQFVDCDLYYDDAWHPFSTSANDTTPWGREIYAAAIAALSKNGQS